MPNSLRWLCHFAAIYFTIAGCRTSAEPAPRAAPPSFSAEDKALFPEDPWKLLHGERPAATVGKEASGAANHEEDRRDAHASPNIAWSKVVDAESLADEIKRIALELNPLLSSETTFRSQLRPCEQAFAELAVLFEVVRQYDGDVRWKSSAGVLRDSLSKAARACGESAPEDEASSESGYDVALEASQLLDDAIRGQQPTASEGGPQETPLFSQIAARPPLMRRMEAALETSLAETTASAIQLKRNGPAVRRESQLLAVLAVVIASPQYEYADDEAFRRHATDLQGAASAMNAAAEKFDDDALQQSRRRAEQSCGACHDEYRG